MATRKIRIRRPTAPSKSAQSDMGWILVLVVGWLLILAPGTIEGSFTPVVSPLIIDSTRPYEKDPEWTEFSGHSVKLRNCSFRRVEWQLGTRQEPNTPIDVRLSAPKIRMKGAVPVEEWRAHVAPGDRLINGTFADVYHQCSLFGIDLPWLTKTRFWN